jgi:hypothetical protein
MKTESKFNLWFAASAGLAGPLVAALLGFFAPIWLAWYLAAVVMGVIILFGLPASKRLNFENIAIIIVGALIPAIIAGALT